MIIEFSVSNFRSFKEKQTLSLVAGRDKAHPGALIPVGKDHLLKSAAIYGANASGKSNLIKAMKVMRDFVRSSATKMNLGDPIDGISPFRLDEETSRTPARFEIKVAIEETQYEYGFSASNKQVFDEWLLAGPSTGSRRKLFRRAIGSGNGKSQWDFGPSLAKDGALLEDRTRENGLALSRGAEMNVQAFSELFIWFVVGLNILDLSDDSADLARKTASQIKDDDGLIRRVSRLLHDADTGISGFEIARRPLPVDDSRHILVSEWMKPGVDLAVYTRHPLPGSDREVEFSLEHDESYGTQKAFALAGPILQALDGGKTLVVDEFECSLHPLLTRKLVEFFQSAEANPNGAQLIFATQDVTVMDPQLLRRDQIWLVEKARNGASDLYSFYDFKGSEKPRSTEAFLRGYLAGRYGGVPDFGPAVENLQVK